MRIGAQISSRVSSSFTLHVEFEITLPDDLLIIHRCSVSGDFSELQLLTSIVSKGNEQFNLNTFYYKYDAPSDAYNCVQTLSRGRVCSLGGSTTQ